MKVIGVEKPKMCVHFRLFCYYFVSLLYKLPFNRCKTMKKWIFLYLLINSTCGFSQVKIGFKAGANLTFPKINDEHNNLADVNPRVGFDFGITAKIRLNNTFSLQPSVMYTRTSYSEKAPEIRSDTLSYSEKNIYKMSYMSLPVNLIASFDLKNDNQFIVFAGGYADMLLNADQVRKYERFNFRRQSSNSGTDESDVFDKCTKWNYGINVGVGYEFGRWQLSASYRLGLRDILKSENQEVYLRTLSINMAFFFDKL